jgi:hypothetical protein
MYTLPAAPKRYQTENICISKGMFVKAINGINQGASDLGLTLRDNPLTGNEIAQSTRFADERAIKRDECLCHLPRVSHCWKRTEFLQAPQMLSGQKMTKSKLDSIFIERLNCSNEKKNKSSKRYWLYSCTRRIFQN